jgi:hypothetical protein
MKSDDLHSNKTLGVHGGHVLLISHADSNHRLFRRTRQAERGLQPLARTRRQQDLSDGAFDRVRRNGASNARAARPISKTRDVGLARYYFRYVTNEISREVLFELHPAAAVEARGEALNATLGESETANAAIEKMIAQAPRRAGSDECVIIGGPPCQVYSIVECAPTQRRRGIRKGHEALPLSGVSADRPQVPARGLRHGECPRASFGEAQGRRACLK